MIEHLKSILENLRKEVKENLKTINQNRQTIDLLKSSISETDELKPQIETLYDTNKTLLLVNDANLKLQNGIVQFITSQQKVINSNKTVMKVPVPKKDGKIDFFKLTVDGEIPFNEFHPKFNDEKFIQKLIEYYIHTEEYEECGRIQKIKSLKQNA
jgi:hypothetical protein